MAVKKKKPTIKDVAKKADVSTMTVVNVLKDRKSEFTETVAKKVRKAAKELGYVKNQTAAALVSRKSSSVALIVINAYLPCNSTHESDVNPYYGELILRMERECRLAGYKLNVYGGDEDDYVNFILEHNAEAAVLLGTRKTKLISTVVNQGVPVVLLDYSRGHAGCMNIKTDEVLGGYLAAEHLTKECGCKRLIYLGDLKMPISAVSQLRLKGAEQACKKYDVKIKAYHHMTSFEDGHRAVSEVKEFKADGVVTAADIIATGLLSGLGEAKIRVPDDVAVVGYDNLLISRMSQPSLTTIDQQLGNKISMVLDGIQNFRPGQQLKVEPSLVVRRST